MTKPPPHRPPVPPMIGLVLGILAVSTASIFIRNAQADAPSLVIAAYRLSLATLLLAPVALTRNRAELRRLTRRELGLALLSGLFLALHFATWITSLEYTSVASSVVLATTTPLWVALLAPLFLKERLTLPVLAGISLALLGGGLVGVSDACSFGAGGLACPSLQDVLQGRAFLGNMLALTGALMAAAYMLIGRRLRGGVSLITYIFVVYGMAALVLVGLTLSAGQPLFGYPQLTYVWLILLAVVPQLLGHSSFNWALRYLPAAYVSVTLLGEAIGSTILAYLFLQESPTGVKIFGAILLLAGIYIASRPEVAQPAAQAGQTAEVD